MLSVRMLKGEECTEYWLIKSKSSGSARLARRHTDLSLEDVVQCTVIHNLRIRLDHQGLAGSNLCRTPLLARKYMMYPLDKNLVRLP